MATVLVGPKRCSFKVNKKLLCAASPFFSERFEGQPHSRPISLWLPGESASMFALFVEWIHSRSGFRWYLDDAIATAQENSQQALREMHWSIIKLHLFASHLSLYQLQDLVMDSIQDLYLKCDWDVPPGLIEFLYTKCEALPAVRLRRWAVAMVAFSLTGGSQMVFHPQGSETSDPSRFQAMLDTLPEFALDYTMHLRKMKGSGLSVRLKNPQLRILANKIRNEERTFGFRECSFHSHRATVGERRCPHDAMRLRTIEQSIHISEDDLAQAGLTGLTAPTRRPSKLQKERDIVDDELKVEGLYEVEKIISRSPIITTIKPSRANTRRAKKLEKDLAPTPVFSRGQERDTRFEEQALKHMRSISSVLK